MTLDYGERVFEADDLHSHAEEVQIQIGDWPSYEGIHGDAVYGAIVRGDEVYGQPGVLQDHEGFRRAMYFQMPSQEREIQKPLARWFSDEGFQADTISHTRAHKIEMQVPPENWAFHEDSYGTSFVAALTNEVEEVRPPDPWLRHEYDHVYWYLSEERLRQLEIARSKNAREGLFAARAHEEVLGFLSHHSLQRHVDDYLSYIEWRREDLEEGESPGIILQSLQSWAWFTFDYARPKGLPYTKLKADFDGNARLTWRLSDKVLHTGADSEYWGNGYGIAVLKFYPSNLNYFSMMSGPFASERRRLTLEGYLSYERTCQVIDMYAERFLNDEE